MRITESVSPGTRSIDESGSTYGAPVGLSRRKNTRDADLSIVSTSRSPRRHLGPIDQIRHELPQIDYLEPAAIPVPQTIRDGLDAESLSYVRNALTTGRRDTARVIEQLVSRTSARRKIVARNINDVIVSGGASDASVHDQFFGLSRVDGASPHVFVKSVFQSIQLLEIDLAETPCSLDEQSLICLDQGLRAIASLAIGTPLPEGVLHARTTEAAELKSIPKRWVRGHHIFAALTQGLILGFNALEAAANASDAEAQRSVADHISAIMLACAFALEFTGDFDPEQYDALVRISMAPPFLPEGFSGLLSQDHRQLVRRMKDTRPAIDGLKDLDPDRHSAIFASLGAVYDSHKSVCARFVGTDRKSLLAASEVAGSAVAQLEKFKQSRFRMLGATCPAGH